MNAAAGLGDFTRVDLGDLESVSTQLLNECPTGLRRDDAIAAERHEIATQIDRILERHIDDLMALGLQPLDDGGLGTGEAHGGEPPGYGHDHQIDVDVVFIEERKTGFPAFLLEPTLDLARAFFLRAAGAAADQHAAFFNDIEVAA